MKRDTKTSGVIRRVIILTGFLFWLMPAIASLAATAIGGEKRPVLSPALFKGKTAYTYQIAREIPAVLDNIYCYCHCQKHSGHNSLLSCYTDEHGAFCDICQNEAIRAYELYKEGKDVQAIKKMVDREFAR
ncbi:MAG: hypothetical protein IT392_12915 [Nitrospirae bacterium]|nr:hypothetical protein [Nitrospirota bacterium]